MDNGIEKAAGGPIFERFDNLRGLFWMASF